VRAARSRRQPHAFHAVQIGNRVGPARDVRLDELRNRVKPGSGGERWRQILRKLGVDDRQPRQHVRATQAGLGAVLGRCQNGIASDLRAGTGGGGDGDEGRGWAGEGFRLPHNLQVVERIAAIAQEGCDGFAGIDSAAAAQRDDQIAVLAAR
jgi:hypothetical protein